MAEVIAKYDTNTKLFSLTMDGKEITDISSVGFEDVSDYMPQMEEDEEKDVFRMVISTKTEDKVNKTCTRQTIYASKAGLNPDLITDSKQFPGLYEIDPAIAGIAALLSNKKK